MSGRQLEAVIKEGRVIHSPLFTVRFLFVDDREGDRFASVVPSKVGKTSAMRHLVRRRMYEAVRYIINGIGKNRESTKDSYTKDGIAPKYHVVILAKNAALDAKPAEMSADLRQIFVKAGLLR